MTNISHTTLWKVQYCCRGRELSGDPEIPGKETIDSKSTYVASQNYSDMEIVMETIPGFIHITHVDLLERVYVLNGVV